MTKRKHEIPISRLLGADVTPDVLRAHAIADTVRALTRHAELDLQNDARAAVAEELGVPELWLDAATGRETVTLDLLGEFQNWHARLGKGGA
jgi:hypothetical protein